MKINKTTKIKTKHGNKNKNHNLNAFVVEQAQEVERGKVNALFSVDYDFVARRSARKKKIQQLVLHYNMKFKTKIH